MSEWVDNVLQRYAGDCYTKKLPKRPLLSKLHKDYFRGKLDSATLRKVCAGTSGDPEVIWIFAEGLKLANVDRVELMIRWGESDLNRYAYRVTPDQHNSLIRNWNEFPKETLKELRSDPIENLIAPRALVVTGISTYLASIDMDLRDIKSIPYSTMARFAAEGIVSTKAFNKVLNEIKPQAPKTNATVEERKIYRERQKTLAKLCANFIEMRLDKHLLDLTEDDLGTFLPKEHERLAAWLIAAFLPHWEDAELIKTLYLD